MELARDNFGFLHFAPPFPLPISLSPELQGQEPNMLRNSFLPPMKENKNVKEPKIHFRALKSVIFFVSQNDEGLYIGLYKAYKGYIKGLYIFVRW